jgi:cytochrome c5
MSMKKIVFAVSAAALMFSVSASARDAQELYNKACIACHASGAAGAPKTGDKAAWTPRLAKGMDTLLTHAKDGFNAMPPKGMCMDCTDAEFKAIIQFMSAAK